MQHALLPLHTIYAIEPEYVATFPEQQPGLTADALLDVAAGEAIARRRRGYNVQADVAVVSVKGVLAKYATAWSVAAGGTAAVDVADAIAAAAGDTSVRAILLEIDSPGGAVAAIERVAAAITRARRVKPVAAFVAGTCAGAAYAVAAETRFIYAAPHARIGAVGCCQVAVDWFTRHDVPAPEPADPEFAQNQLDVVEQIEQVLAERLSELRPALDPRILGPVRNGELLIAEQAEAAGLVDEILPREAVIDRLHRDDHPTNRARSDAT